MILDNPMFRLMLKALSACGLMDSQGDSAAGRNRAVPGDSPFVLVARACDGKWGVFQRDFDTPLASFDEMQEACDHANELATRTDAMVLMGRPRDSAAGQHSTTARAAT